MKVCLLSREYPPETGWGGIGTYTYNLAHGLAELGHEVDVISMSTDCEKEYLDGGVHIHRVLPRIINPLLKRPIRYVSPYAFFCTTMVRLGWSWAAFRKVREISMLRRIDVVEAPEHGADGFFFSLFKTAPLIIRLHTPSLLHRRLNELPDSLDFRLLDIFEKLAVKRADVLTSPSRSMAELISPDWGLVKIEVIPNPIDERIFFPSSEAGGDGRTVLYVGRLEKRKGVDVLVEAFWRVVEEFPSARLLLVGSDTRIDDGKHSSFVDYLRTKLGDAGESVKFVGRVDREELVGYYQRSEICVIPSVVFENFPYTCLEAMACGKPVVASDCGGIREMIEDGVNGLLVPPGDVVALSEALIRLLTDRSLSLEMGRRARERVERLYSRKAVVGKILEVYRGAMG